MTTYYAGWSSDPEYKRLQKGVQEAAQAVIRDKDIETINKNIKSARVSFKGRLKPGSKVTEYQLLAWADNGNLCFGGSCTIDGTDFSGYYFTD